MSTNVNISRRTFIKASAVVAGGLVIAFSIPYAKRFMHAEETAKQASPANPLPEPNAFLKIGTDDSITVLLAHSEMGQGIWTTLPMLIAEELDADWSKIQVEHAGVAPVYAHTAYGIQIPGGSSTTWSEFDRYRQAGALTRALLLNAAAKQWNVPVEQLKTESGAVIHGDQRLRYGELAELASTIEKPTSVKLKDPKDWKMIGRATKRLDSLVKLDGTAKFGQDIQFEGLKTALVARAPVFGASVKSFDATAAKQVKGVVDVVQVPTGVAVIAEHFWAAKQGREALKIEWDTSKLSLPDTTQLIDQYRALAKQTGKVAATAGDMASAANKDNTPTEVEYVLPFLAHAPMEPLNCTVKINTDSCEIWTGTQMQTVDQGAAAKILGLKPEQVSIHTQFLGGGFGRRANPHADFVSEAVEVAKAAKQSVKTVWTREDDIKGGYYRPMFLHQVAVTQGADGVPFTWQHRLVGQSIIAGTPFESVMVKNEIDATSVEGVADSPYLKAVPHYRVELHTVKSEIPVLWWRSVGHSHTAFVMETLIDQLADQAKQDPFAYRQALLKAHPRHLAALNLAAEKAEWGSPLPSGVARGIAVHESFGSVVAQVAEVTLKEGQVKVQRMVCAIDCGLAVNPDGVKVQMESAIAYGLGAALYSEVTFKEGKVVQSNFNDYQVARITDMPKVEVYIVQSQEKMGGVGEPGLPPVAPAVANALYSLTGKRIRSLPLQAQVS